VGRLTVYLAIAGEITHANAHRYPQIIEQSS